MSLRNLTQVSAIAFATLAMSSSLFAQQHNHADHKHESHGHDHSAMKQGPNGGTIQMVGTHRIETVTRPNHPDGGDAAY